MHLSAYVRDKQTKETTVIVRDYPTKAAFQKDLRSNGYAVIRISNKRDLHCQEFYGVATYSEMKSFKKMYLKDPVLWAKELQRLAEIESIEL